jgi:hypothetical protein
MSRRAAALLLCWLLPAVSAAAQQSALHGAVLLNDNTSLLLERCVTTPHRICAPCDAAELTTLLHIRNASWSQGFYTLEGRDASGRLLFALPDVPLGPRDGHSWDLGDPLYTGFPFVGEATAFVTADVPVDVTVEYLAGGEDEAEHLGAEHPMTSASSTHWRSHTVYAAKYGPGPAQQGVLYLINPDPRLPASGQVRFLPPGGGIDPGTGGPAFTGCVAFADIPPMGFRRIELSTVAAMDPAAGWIEVSTADAVDLGPGCSLGDPLEGTVSPVLLVRVGFTLDVWEGRCPAGGGLALPSYVEALEPAGVSLR